MVSTAHDRVADFWRRLGTPEPPCLDQRSRPGTLGVSAVQEVVSQLAAGAGMDGDAGRRLLAAALLYHDHHNEAHDLVQDLTDPDGAFIHALLHRREPDFWNARYWFRRAGDHPVHRAAVERLPAGTGGAVDAVRKRLILTGTVDSGAMVDACEQAYGASAGDPVERFLRGVQQAEFEALIAHLLA